MSGHTFAVELYDSVLKSKIITLLVVAIVLLVCFVVAAFYCIREIKDKKTKLSYVVFLGVVTIFLFLLISLGSQILTYCKDYIEKAYVQYEGSATIQEQTVFGRNPSDYIISFVQDGELVELVSKKKYEVGDVEKIYIVYTKHSKCIIEIVIEQKIES